MAEVHKVPTLDLPVPSAPKDPRLLSRRNNQVVTSKYTLINFLPYCLLLQFRRFTNAFYLVIVLAMMASEFSGGRLFVSPYISTGTIMLLGVVVTFTIITEAKDDIKRHRDDWQTNKQQVRRLRSTKTPEGLKPTVSKWGDLKPGDVIRINNREEVPADVMLLMSTNPNGRCYIETSGIDGETNLKIKEVCKGIRGLIEKKGDDWRKAIQGTLTYEEPNAFLQFTGVFKPDDESAAKVALDFGGIVLRGSELRNTEYVIAMVVYAGHETKLVMSKRDTPTKFSLLNKAVNKLMYFTMFFYVALICFLSVWLLNYVESTEGWSYFKFTSSVDAFILPGFLAYFLTFAVLFTNLVPINVVVSQEFANLVQAFYIRQDVKMYDEETDTCADARSSALMAEIGQVTHIFSDKTGTLTRNVMRLVGCSVGGAMYGHVPEEAPESRASGSDDSERSAGVKELVRAAIQRTKSKADNRARQIKRLQNAAKGLSSGNLLRSAAKRQEPGSDSRPALAARDQTVVPQDGAHDRSIEELFAEMAEAMKHDPRVREQAGRFLLVLALCHTVVIDRDENGEIRYNAEGPDEEALVSAAARLGYRLQSTDDGATVVRFPDGSERSYQLLGVNTFSSLRKRMSVVVQDDQGKYWLLMKGADNVILGLLAKSVRQQDRVVLSSQLDAFARGGLRTLVMVQRELDPAFFQGWKGRYEAALTAPADQRKAALARAAAEVERDCELVGASAIEDELQEGVPAAVTKIRNAGITLWVLTGDKLQTAVNIALTANLLDNSMLQLKLESKDQAVLERQLANMRDLLLRAGAQQQKAGARRPKARPREDNLVISIRDPEALDAEEELKKLRLKTNAPGLPFVAEGLALVITGDALEQLITSQKGTEKLEKLFLAVLRACKVVLACRVSPVQKALIVRLVVQSDRAKNEPPPVSLAIGDGANDVPMIQEARVGVGISGKEGLQAVNSSDFSIAQFRFLERLLFVHGRWNYRRNTFVIKFTTYAWQVLAYLILFFLFDSLVSGQQVFYNTYYVTLFPWLVNSFICAITWFDQDISDESALHLPYTYMVGRLNKDMNNKQLLWVCIQSLIHSSILYSTLVLTADKEVDLSAIGIAAFTGIVFALMAVQLFLMNTWNYILLIAIVFWLFLFGLSNFAADILLGYDYQILIIGDAAGFTWVRVFLATVSVFLFEFALHHIKREFFPTNMDIITEMDRGFFKGSMLTEKDSDVLDRVAESTRKLVFGSNLIPTTELRRAISRTRGDSEVAGLTNVDARTSFDFSAPDGAGGSEVNVNRLSKRISVRRSVVALGDVHESAEESEAKTQDAGGVFAKGSTLSL